MPNATPTPPARESLIDSRTNFVSRPWYMFFQSLYQSAQTALFNYIGAQPPPDGQSVRYDSVNQGWTNTTGFNIFDTGELLISNPSLENAGRGITIDNVAEAGFGYLAFTSSTSVTQLVAQDSGVVFSSPEIELASGGYFFANAGGVRCLVLSGINGFMSLGVGSPPEPTAQLDISNNTIRLRNSRTPSSATAAGNRGDICWDTNYIYVCVNTNTWKRTAISTW